jgi:hypothetical protein
MARTQSRVQTSTACFPKGIFLLPFSENKPETMSKDG